MTPHAGASVTVADAAKVFTTAAGVVRAVDDVDLDVPGGSTLAITGRSGSGKSTLLALIGALEAPTSGRVSIGGHRVDTMSARERARLRRELIGFVFQSDNLQPFLTATENVALAMSLTGRPPEPARADELLERLGLAGLGGRFPDALSGGERQRVAIARALVHRPSLILADEPTGALDSVSSQRVIDLLLAAQGKTGATLIVITHNAEVASRFDRQAEMSNGRLRASLVGSLEPAGGSDV